MLSNAASVGFLIGVGLTVVVTLIILLATSSREKRPGSRINKPKSHVRENQRTSNQRGRRRQCNDEDDPQTVEGFRESAFKIPPADVQKIEGVPARNEIFR